MNEASSGVVTTSRRNGDFASKTFNVPIELHPALHAVLYHALHYTGAKTLRGEFDRRSSHLSPAEHELSICRGRPLDTNLT
jgi:hypothetical protein